MPREGRGIQLYLVNANAIKNATACGPAYKRKEIQMHAHLANGHIPEMYNTNSTSTSLIKLLVDPL